MMENSSYRTPLGRVRGLGASRTGTEHFWRQRLTAVALVPLTLIFVVLLLRLSGGDYGMVVRTLGHPVVAGLGILLIVAAFWHLQLGLRVVIEDYVHREGPKLVLQTAQTFACAAFGLACVLAVLKLAYG